MPPVRDLHELGVLLAGMALPAAGALGLSAKSTADSFDSIPDDFKTPPLSQASQTSTSRPEPSPGP